MAALLVLAGCGNPFAPDSGGGGGTVSSIDVPASVKVDMKSATYVPGDPTIQITMTAQDAAALSATYTRDPTYDVDDYQAYTYQETGSNRYIVALVKQAGDAKGLVAVEGGQFGDFHGGGDFVRATADLFTLPASGVGAKYDYSGTYVGMMSLGVDLPGPGGDLSPTRAYRTSGRALITADFTEMSVTGGVDQRTILDPRYDSDGNLDPTLNVLETISLKETGITDSGAFAGKVALGTVKPGSEPPEVGDYAGLFAGLDASQIAALLVFKPYNNQIVEHGLIVLDNCADAGGPACP